MSDISVTLDCGCDVVIRREWESPVCDCCGPGDWYYTGCTLRVTCPTHSSSSEPS